MAQRAKTSVRAVEYSNKKALWIILWITFIHIAAIAQFTRGFLLTRPVLVEESTRSSLSNPPFERAVVLVVDALRYDFVETPLGSPEVSYLRHFPVSQIATNPKNAFTVRFLADPPTTTLQRLKGLTTGSLPAFIDAGSNFAGSKIEEDNWVSQAAKNLGPVAFVGDDTWDALFSHVFSENHPYPSLNVRDLDTVDNAVKYHLPSLIANTTNKVVIGHMLGVDHVGHRYGPAHPAMSKKLDETFTFVQEITKLIDDKTVLIVMGDHGMDQTGNHGGDSQDELNAALWMYSKRPLFVSEGSNTVQQIDLVPTICGLLGIPIPFNSLGYPIRQAFKNKHWNAITEETKRQLQTYTEAVNLASANQAIARALGEPPREFQQILLETYRDAWVQFDQKAMISGIGLLAASIIGTILMYNTVSDKVTTRIVEYLCYGGILGLGSGVLTNIHIFGEERTTALISIAFCTATGALVGSALPALWFLKPCVPSVWSFVGGILLCVEVASGFSNSFVIWESRILQFLLATTFTLLAIGCARTASPLLMYLGSWYAGALLFVLRLSSSWVVCREETASRCQTTFFEPGSSLVPIWTIFAIGVLGLVLPFFLKRFWTIGKNDVGVANLMLNMTPLAMTIVVAYWSLDNAEARGWISHTAFGLQTGKLLLGRFALTLGVVGGLIIWWRSNVPIEIVIKNNRPEKIEGYNNIHGAYALLTAVCLFWSFSVTHKPPAILSFAGLLYTCLGTLDLIDVSESKYTMIVPVLFDMISHAYFYYTGHQATIASIQWDTAFIAARTISYPWSPISVILNTFSPFLLAGIVCTFSAFWRRPPFRDPKQPVIFVLRNVLGLTSVGAVRAIGSMIGAGMLRRHLMAWKIFAPRFMFGALGLVAADVACIIGVLLSGHTIKKVAEMFGAS